MITGKVTNTREAIIPLIVIGADGRQHEIEALVDTGFDGWLTLPAQMISLLQLSWRGRGGAFLADGRETVFDVYEGNVIWHQYERRLRVDQAETEPLIGMALLEGSELNIQVRKSGAVTITILE
jgi:clan AA aspartic protease